MKIMRIKERKLSRLSLKPQTNNWVGTRSFSASDHKKHSTERSEPGVDFSIADIDIFPKERVQPKLKLGPVADRCEQEADRMARQVVETISSPDQDSVQRKDGDDEDELDLEERKKKVVELRRKVAGLAPAGGADVGPDLESAIRRARGRGVPLSDRVRQPMERAFGADFGGVRVHAGGEADSLNRSIQAQAFTTRQDIFLRQGEYRPGSSEGQRLLAHELTHVVQQMQGGGNAASSIVQLKRFYRWVPKGYADTAINKGLISHNVNLAMWIFDMEKQYRPANTSGSLLLYYDLDSTAEENIEDMSKQINFESNDFKGEGKHPRMVIVKNNEVGAYGLGKMRQWITNMHVKKKGYASKAEVAKALGLELIEVINAYKPKGGWVELMRRSYTKPKNISYLRLLRDIFGGPKLILGFWHEFC